MANQPYKILILGSAGVGKSQLTGRLVDDRFQTDYLPTMGADFKNKTLNGQKLQIWELGGQKRFGQLMKSFVKDAHGYVIIYDVTDIKTFLDLEIYFDGIRSYEETAPILLIGNKNDLESRMVDEIDARIYAREKQCDYLETSVKNTKEIDQIFSRLIEMINAQSLKQHEGTDNYFPKQSLMLVEAVADTENDNHPKKKFWCCC